MSQDNNKSSDSAHEQSVKYVPPKVWVQDKGNGGKSTGKTLALAQC